MKLLKILSLIVATLVVAVVVVGLSLPGVWTIEKSISVKASPETVLDYIGDLKSWETWTVWTREKYPAMKIEHPGATRGVGAIQRWNDGSMGGEIEVTEFDPTTHISYRLEMDQGASRMECRIAAVDVAEGSVVTWTCGGDVGSNPLNRVLSALFRPMISRDFEGGLDNLAAHFAAPKG